MNQRKLLVAIGLATIPSLLFLALALISADPATAATTQADSLQVYAFAGNTTTFEQKEAGAYQWDWSRFGFRAYTGENFMLRMEYDFSSNAMKYSYLEYMNNYHNWKLGLQFGRWLIPCMYNWPGPSTLAMPRWSYSQNDLSVYGTGLSGYAKHGQFKLQAGTFGYQNYVANVQYGPISAWWTKDEGQGAFFKQSFCSWLNLFTGWTNYENRPGRDFPNRRNAAFVENHIRLGNRVRVYTQYDFGDFNGTFISGISYLLIPGDVENTISVFYDSQDLWQARLTFSFNQMFRL